MPSVMYCTTLLQGYCNSNLSGNEDKYGDILISGDVEYNTNTGSFYPTSSVVIYFTVSAVCNGGGGTITWGK